MQQIPYFGQTLTLREAARSSAMSVIFFILDMTLSQKMTKSIFIFTLLNSDINNEYTNIM
jgi:hypothetical protein